MLYVSFGAFLLFQGVRTVKGELVMVKINGEDKEIAGRNLLEYLNEAGFETERVAVSYTHLTLPTSAYV